MRETRPARSSLLLVDVGERTLPVRVRRNRRARRLVLRLAPDGSQVTVTLPSRVPLGEGLAFVRSHRDWLALRLAAVPARIPFTAGAEVPYLGLPHRVVSASLASGPIRREAGVITVSGNEATLPRRLALWFRREARREVDVRSAAMAARLGRSRGLISIRDPRSRWGSCATSGNLSFSWRLILAPEPVLDYVVAHEVAHLAVRGHSALFWDTVRRLVPEMDGARRWLRQEGSSLHRYG